MRKKDNIKYLKNISNVIRKNVVKMLNSAGSGHPGGSLSSTDILVSLYFYILVTLIFQGKIINLKQEM